MGSRESGDELFLPGEEDSLEYLYEQRTGRTYPAGESLAGLQSATSNQDDEYRSDVPDYFRGFDFGSRR